MIFQLQTVSVPCQLDTSPWGEGAEGTEGRVGGRWRQFYGCCVVLSSTKMQRIYCCVEKSTAASVSRVALLKGAQKNVLMGSVDRIASCVKCTTSLFTTVVYNCFSNPR